MITVSELTKRFSNLTAVNHLTMQIESGEMFGFIGPNGAGKTTTINMLTGLVRPTSGRARICGFDVQTEALKVKSITGLMSHTPELYDVLTGRQFVRFIADLYGVTPEQSEKTMEELLERFDLTYPADELIKSYSHGMQKKILLTAVLVHEPRVLFLDEPTSGLDPKSARTVKEILRERCDLGCTVFMTTHVLEIAERVCDRIGIINRGNLIAIGTVEQLCKSSTSEDASLEDVFITLTQSTDCDAFE